MSVHYKFKSALEYDTVTFDGLHISVKDLKNAIAQKKMIGKTTDFDLQVTNAQTKEVYADENALIPKNTSLLIARIPNAIQNKNKQWEGYGGDNTPPTKLDEGGPIAKAVDLSSLDAPEDDKIKAMMSQSTQDYDPSNYLKIRGANQMGEVPTTYRCYKCHKMGHWIKDCPLSKGPEPIEIKKSTGIPLSFMVPVDGPQVQGAMMTPNGSYAVPVLDHQAYMQKPSVQNVPEVTAEIPEDLLCSICSDLLQDAVMIPCCGNSFCDECIRSVLLESEDHECPDCHEKDISPGTLIPNRFLRTSVGNFKNTTGYVKKMTYKKQETAKSEPVKQDTEEKTVISEADSTEHAKNEAKIEAKSSPKVDQETTPEGPPGVSPEESPKTQPIEKVESSRERVERTSSRPVKPTRREESPSRRHRHGHRSPAYHDTNRSSEDRPGTPTVDEPGITLPNPYHSYPSSRAPPASLMVQPQPPPMQAPPPGYPPPQYGNGPPPPNFRIPPPGAPPYIPPQSGYGPPHAPPPSQPPPNAGSRPPIYDATSRPPPPVYGHYGAGSGGHHTRNSHHHHHHREYMDRGGRSGGGMRGGRSPPSGTIDDPLAAFNRMLREKDERDRRKRGRQRSSRSRSWSRSPRRMRSRSPRRRSRSRSFSISRSRSRSFSGSPFRELSPPPRRNTKHRYRASPGQRSPPPRHHRKEGADRYRGGGYEHERGRGYSRDKGGEHVPRRDERDRDYPSAYEAYDERRNKNVGAAQANWSTRMQPQDHYYPPEFANTNRYPPSRDYPYKLPEMAPVVQPLMRQYEDVAPPGVEEPPIPGIEDAPPPALLTHQSPPPPVPPQSSTRPPHSTGDRETSEGARDREHSSRTAAKQRTKKTSRTPSPAAASAAPSRERSKSTDRHKKRKLHHHHEQQQAHPQQQREKERERDSSNEDEKYNKKTKEKKKKKERRESEKKKKKEKKEKHREKKHKDEPEVKPHKSDKAKKDVGEKERVTRREVVEEEEHKEVEETFQTVDEVPQEKHEDVEESKPATPPPETEVSAAPEPASKTPEPAETPKRDQADTTSPEREEIVPNPDDSEGIILDLHPTDFDLKTPDIDGKSEVAHLLPEKSKWEVEMEDDVVIQLSPTEAQQMHSNSSESVTTAGKSADGKSSKVVTNEVLKRAENAIFAKAINAIRPIEIKKISTERAKLYANEEEEEDEEEVEIIEEKPAERKRIEAPSPTHHPPRLSVKERLGIKIDDLKPERNKSSSMSPFSRRNSEGARNYGLGERRVEVLESRRRRDNRSRDRDKHRDTKSHSRKRSRSRKRETRDDRSATTTATATSAPSVKRDVTHEKEKKTRSRRSESEDAKSKKKDKKVKSGKEKKRDEEKPDKKEKKATIDEANFEPDYDLESESEKEEKKKKKEEDEASVSSSESSDSSSEEERSKKRKHKKHKKRKRRESSSSSSDSESDSSDDEKEKKRKKHKKSKKKKKRSKHK